MDVAIIGGGIVGTSAAAFLAGAGARVVVYEREAIAAGASGRNSGVVQHPFDPALVPLYHETVEIYRSLDDEAVPVGFRLGASPVGLLLATPSVDLARRLAADLGALHPQLVPEALDPDEVRRLEPSIAPGIAACRIGIGFPIVPSAPTYAMATLAERRGALIRQGRSAVPVIDRDRCVGVSVDGRIQPADAVVVAAGPWTPAVVDPTGVWRPIRPAWGVVVEILLADPPRHVMEEAGMDAALATDATTDPGDDGDAHGSSVGYSLVTADGVSVVGSTFLHDEPDPSAWRESLLARAARFVPAIAEAPIRETRACARPASLDGRPLIGTLPGIDGLFVCSGHGPWGITTGPASARLVADLVLDRNTEVPVDLRADRFGAIGI